MDCHSIFGNPICCAFFLGDLALLFLLFLWRLVSRLSSGYIIPSIVGFIGLPILLLSLSFLGRRVILVSCGNRSFALLCFCFRLKLGRRREVRGPASGEGDLRFFWMSCAPDLVFGFFERRLEMHGQFPIHFLNIVSLLCCFHSSVDGTNHWCFGRRE
jgi:hypothetical protein